MVLDDLGNAGAGGSKVGSVTIPVVVRPTNHAPSLTLPAALSAVEDGLLSLAAVQVSDADPGDTITVDVAVSLGGLVQLNPLQLDRFTVQLKSYHQHRFAHQNKSGEPDVCVAILRVTSLLVTFCSDFALLGLISPYEGLLSTVHYSGSASAVRTALSSLHFLPAEDSCEAVDLTVAVSDAQQLARTASSRISVESVNDPPHVILRAHALQTTEDTPLPVPGVRLSDPDLPASGVLQVVVEVSNGGVDLNMTRLSAQKASATGNDVQLLEGSARNNSRLVIVGAVADLNALLADGFLVYVPCSNMNLNWGEELGVGSVRFTAREFDVHTNAVIGGAAAAAHLFSTAELTVHVTPVNDPPVVTAPSVLETREDTPLRLAGIAVEDIDWHEVRGGVLRANVSVMFGSLSVDAAVMHRLGQYRNPATGGTSPSLNRNGGVSEHSSMLLFRAHVLADLNELLRSVVYTPAPDRNGEDYLQVTVADTANASDAAAAYVTIQVAAANDAPTIVAPAHIVTRGDELYSIGSVKIWDVDFLTNPVQSALLSVTISAEHGGVKLTGKNSYCVHS